MRLFLALMTDSDNTAQNILEKIDRARQALNHVKAGTS